MDKQVKVRNPNGLHEPLITVAQHEALISIFAGKKKTQLGPRKNGNPKYPLNNIVYCDLCHEQRYDRMVGVDINNGKNKAKIYEKYRCRECKRSLKREELHDKISEHFQHNPVTQDGVNEFAQALAIAWKKREVETQQEVGRLKHKIKALGDSISQQVEAVADPTNAIIKDEIIASITKKKAEVADIEGQLQKLVSQADDDWEQFLRFAYGFVNDISKEFLNPDLSLENRLRCKQIIFPAGFRLDANKNVYTPEISPLITLLTKKKSTEVLEDSHLVQHC